MWDFSIGRALGLMGRTWPFIAFRMVVYFGIAVAYVLVTGVGAGVGWGVGAFGDADFQASTSIWGGIAGFGLTAGVIYFLREYILYIVKAGHIAVMVELMEGKDIPDGRSQIDYASGVVKERFAEASVLFGVDQMVKGVLGAITGIVQGIASILPIPGLQQMVGVLRAFLRVAVGLVDEVILAYAIRTRSTNPWDSAKTALVLYGQNYKVMFKNAAWITVFTYGLSFIVFLLMLAPAAAVVWMIPGSWAAGGFIFALLFAWAVKVALIEPFATACLMEVYFKTVEGQSPDPAWDQRLTSASNKFGQLKEKAASWASRRFGGATAM
jgi:hypothetical protein